MVKYTFPVILILTLVGVPELKGAENLKTTRELTAMLRQFLKDAAEGNRQGFEKFFADDVVYTRATGAVIDKDGIMNGIERLKPTEESKTTYSAEEIMVQDYGDTAVVAFRLAARTEHKDGKVETAFYRNTGTFLRRHGHWRVIAWQATAAPDAGPKSNQ